MRLSLGLALFLLWTSVEATPRSRWILRNKPFGTHEGLSVDMKVPLRHPKTNLLDRQATIIALSHCKFSGIPVVDVRFTDGHRQRHAADRIHLIGQSFKVRRAYLVRQRRAWNRAIRAELGLDVSKVPLQTMNDVLLHRKRNGEGRIRGFHRGGKTFVSRHLQQFAYLTPIHELLHAASRSFSSQTNSTALTEGLTEYFAHRVAFRRFGFKTIERSHSYFLYYRVAVRLAEIVGPRKLKRLFFSKNNDHAVKELGNLVDKKVWWNAFERSINLLSRRNSYAFTELRGHPSTNNPFVRKGVLRRLFRPGK